MTLPPFLPGKILVPSTPRNRVDITVLSSLFKLRTRGKKDKDATWVRLEGRGSFRPLSKYQVPLYGRKVPDEVLVSLLSVFEKVTIIDTRCPDP